MTYKPNHPAYNYPWPKIKNAILTRDNHTCQIQLPGCTGTATTADHITPILAGGPWHDPANLRAACTHCNQKRAAQTRRNRNNKRHQQRTQQPSRNW